MPVNVTRRHLKTCPHKEKGRRHVHQCKCPIQVDGSLLNGIPIKRHTLGTGNMTLALKTIQTWEARGSVVESTPEKKGTPLVEAVQRFLQYVEHNRHISGNTLYNYRRAYLNLVNTRPAKARLMLDLESFCKGKGIRFVEEITMDDLEALQREWNGFADTSIAVRTVLMKTLWAFFNRKGISTLDTSELYVPDISASQKTKPFEQDEMRAILEVVRSRPMDLAYILFMRYSGLRNSDAATCAKDRLIGNSLILRQMKNDALVSVKLPNAVVRALDQFKPKSPLHWFWDGRSSVKALTQHWYKRIKSICAKAGIPEGHPHMLRDTFAVEAILGGMDLKAVSTLLGHATYRTTENHYLYWVKMRQIRADEQVCRLHEQDPILHDLDSVPEKVRTLQVHRKTNAG
jgi:site-specific recombinase XerD